MSLRVVQLDKNLQSQATRFGSLREGGLWDPMLLPTSDPTSKKPW